MSNLKHDTETHSAFQVSDEVWASLYESKWRRRKWRQEQSDEIATCCIYGTPIHREGTYYLRPAYTDGIRWLSAQAFRDWQKWMGKRADNRYSRKNTETNPN